jgi:hypothetical protein
MHVNCLPKDLSVKKIIHPLLGCKHLLPLMITGGSTMLNYMIGLCKFLDTLTLICVEKTCQDCQQSLHIAGETCISDTRLKFMFNSVVAWSQGQGTLLFFFGSQ